MPAFNHNGRLPTGMNVAPERIVENQKFILGHDIDKYYLQFQKFGGRGNQADFAKTGKARMITNAVT